MAAEANAGVHLPMPGDTEKMLDVPPAVHNNCITPGWQYQDVFHLDTQQDSQLRRQLAVYMGVKYTDTINGGKPFALEVSGVCAYDPAQVQAQYNNYHSGKRSAFEGANVSLDNLKAVSCTVNGCQVAWVETNLGYIKAWADANLAKWDTGVERKAGGLDPSIAWSAQHFVCTNQSSLMALIGEVVYQLKTKGSVEHRLQVAFKSIRVLLYMDASADEILVWEPNSAREGNDWWRECRIVVSMVSTFCFVMIF